LIEWPQRFPDLLDMASMFISMRDVGRSKREITLLSQAEARRFF
jgi:tRNA A37 threonylcarbamoyladenosine biosynthesis protein TsaE